MLTNNSNMDMNPAQKPNMQPNMQPNMNMPEYTQKMPMQDNSMQPYAFYPEIYMVIQPYVIMVCDQMEAYGTGMPSRQTVESISDSICDDITRRYPDMADYVGSFENGTRPAETERAAIEPYFYEGGYDRFRRDFRRRGLFRDLTDILLLSELFRRRRRRDRFDRFDFDRYGY